MDIVACVYKQVQLVSCKNEVLWFGLKSTINHVSLGVDTCADGNDRIFDKCFRTGLLYQRTKHPKN